MTLLEAPPQVAAPRRSWLRAATAAGALLVLAAGIPTLLALLIGWPLPHQLPTGGELRHAITAPVSARVVIDVFACLAWLAWGHLLGSVVVEFVVQLRGRNYPRAWPRRLPTQALACRLVSGLLLALPTAPLVGHALPAAAVTPAATTVERAFLTPVAYPRDPHASTSPAPGDEPRGGATTPPGRARVHETPLKRYVVEQPHDGHYDSLWDIAERHLGDALRYREIYQLNKGRQQPDGGELTEASLIRPGWVLLLPADAHGPGLEPVGETANHEPPAPSPTPGSTIGRAHGPANDVANQPAAPAGDPTAVPEQSAPPRLGRQTTHPASHGANRPQHGTRLPLDLGIGVAAVAALAALERARRIAQRRRPLRRRVAPVPATLQPVEAELRRQARHAEPAAAAVRLAAALTVTTRPTPQIVAVTVRADGGVELSLDHPVTPVPPFTGSPQRWQLPPGGGAYGFAVDDQLDPCPAMVPLGRDADGEVSIDIEPAGFTVITGDTSLAATIVTRTAASLLGAPWASPPVHVYAPPHVATLVGPLEHLHATPDPSLEIVAIREQSTVVRQECLAAGVSSLPELRRNGGAGITSLLAFVGWHSDDIPADLIELAVDPATPVVVLGVGDHPRAVQRWQLCGTTMQIPGIDNAVTVLDGGELPQGTGELLIHTLQAPDVPADAGVGAALLADAPPQHEATDIEIRILGPVDITGVQTPRRTPVLAMLIYLALHRRGVDAETLATALWPDKVVASKTLRNRISEARTLVGNAITDGPGWRLEGRVGCDWQRFQALAAGNLDAKRAALELVRGRPFQGLLDADWADLEGFRTEIESAVVDAAVEVAEQALAGDDPAAAFSAARTGLNASPYEERLYRIAMRAADAEGSTGKVRALMRELQTVLDVDIEPDDELQQETLETYRELVGKSLREASG